MSRDYFAGLSDQIAARALADFEQQEQRKKKVWERKLEWAIKSIPDDVMALALEDALSSLAPKENFRKRQRTSQDWSRRTKQKPNFPMSRAPKRSSDYEFVPRKRIRGTFEEPDPQDYVPFDDRPRSSNVDEDLYLMMKEKEKYEKFRQFL